MTLLEKAGDRAQEQEANLIARGTAPSNRHAVTTDSRRHLAALAAFAGAVFLALYPMLWHSYLPLVDIPNHIARLTVMAQQDGPLTAYYTTETNWLTPNSAVDLLWQATGMQSDPVAFARATMMAYAVNFILSVMVLSRVATGRWSAWPTVTGLLVYNGSFVWGFQNYVFTVPFALHALSLWLVMERRSPWLRVAVFLPAAALLFLMHLLAFGMLATAVFGREVHRLLIAGRLWPRQFGIAVVSGIPFAVPLLWYAYQTMANAPGVLGIRTDFGGWAVRLRALLSVQWERPLIGEAQGLLLSGLWVFVLLGLCFLTLLVRTGPRLRLVGPLIGPIVALISLSVLSPSWLNGVALVEIRFPFVALAVLIAGSQWTDLRPRHTVILTVLFAAAFAYRSSKFEQLWAVHNSEVRDLRTVISELPAGSRLLPLRGDGFEMMRRLWHVQAYATTYQKAFVPTFFQGTHGVSLKSRWQSHAALSYMPIEARRLFDPDPDIPPLPNAYLGNRYWEDWENKFTHVLFLERMPVPKVAGKLLTITATAGRFTLLEIRPPS